MLANLTLDGLETLLRKHYPSNTKIAQRAKVNLIRYADDFVITGSSKGLLENEVKPLVEQFLAERGLELDQHPFLYCDHDPVNDVDPSGPLVRVAQELH